MQEEMFHAPSIWETLALVMPPGAVIEIRGLGAEGGGTVSGYFNERDKAFSAACALSGKAEGIYITLNPVNPALIARAENRIKRNNVRWATSDDEVIRRRLMVIDIDPIRPKGISATDGEHEVAMVLARDIRRALASDGWDAPIFASSGNGAHLIYSYEGANSPEVRDFLKATLLKLSQRFSDAEAVVDAAMFNASRICRLYGTMACKGDSTDDRPHRISRILERQSDANA